MRAMLPRQVSACKVAYAKDQPIVEAGGAGEARAGYLLAGDPRRYAARSCTEECMPKR